MINNKIIVYTDGGSRGNPGPAAIGTIIHYGGKEKHYSEAIGETTNNVAEYRAVIFALKKVKHLIGKEKAKKSEVKINSDSELLVNQLQGNYKIKNEGMGELFIEIWNLKQDFEKVEFNLVPRERNRAADKLANQALDALI